MTYGHMEKPCGYHGEWSALGGPKAKTLGAAGLDGFWLRDLPRLSIHHETPKAFPYVNLLASRTSKEGFISANGLPREYHGQYLSFAGQTLVKLNPIILVRDVKRMSYPELLRLSLSLQPTTQVWDGFLQ